MSRILTLLFSALLASAAFADGDQLLTVIDGKTGKPMEKAEVLLLLRHIQPIQQKKMTRKDGVVDLTEFRHFIWGIDISKRSYVSESVPIPPNWPVKVVLKLKKKGAR